MVPGSAGHSEQRRMSTVMRNVAVGLRRRLVRGLALVFAVLVLGESTVQLARIYPQQTRLFVAGFVALSLTVLLLLWKRK